MKLVVSQNYLFFIWLILPEGGRGVAPRVSILVDEATGVIEGKLLSDIEDGVR